MIKQANIITTILLATACSVNAQKPVRVLRVIDADTYELKADGKKFTARLASVDAPESKQHYGIDALQQVIKAIAGKAIAYDSVKLDRYKRVIVRLYVDGKAMDSILIRNGCAWVYADYCNAANLAKFANLQKLAIAERKGLWACGVSKVCPPWLYRQYNYRNRMKYCKGCKL